MGRNKDRKGRLDKGSVGTSDFIGFGAFASTSSQQDTAEAAPQLKWSPVYAGSDAQLSLLFKKIGQKRDSVTKARALTELETYFTSEEVSRKEQVPALSHLLFVYHSKLSYDSSSAVRAAALSCLKVARSRVPKAFNTLWEQHPDLQGMVWCARTDPTAEVRAVASDGPSCSQKGMCEYVSRILGYGRARNMHDALFARKMDPGELSESEREQAEERFERIVGTCLSGMSDYVQQHPEESCDTPYGEYFSDGILWKGMVSPKSSIRRKDYMLFATLVGNAQSLIYGPAGISTLPKQLVNAVAQEKDAANIPSLLEVLLLYITSFQTGEKKWSDVVDVSLLCKHVNKMVRKACYGASAGIWGPSILPLVASLPTHLGDNEPFHFQKQLLSSLWQGREYAILSGDTLSICSALAECSSFLLLRRQQDASSSLEESTCRDVADFFLKALSQYLVARRASPLEKDAEREFGESLAGHFCNMEVSSKDRSDCAFHRIHTYFWNEGVRAIIVTATNYSQLNRLIQCLLHEEGRVRSPEEPTVHVGRLEPVFREKFQLVVSQYQSKSGSVPDLDAYDCMISFLSFCGPRFIFETPAETEERETTGSSGIEHFILNDLLRWTVIHASSLSTESTHHANGRLLKRDFSLLRLCLPSISSPMRQKVLWETTLREMTAAKCDLNNLATGLTVLLTGTGDESSNQEWVEILRSNEIMEQLAIEAGCDAAQHYRNSVCHRESYGDQESETSDISVTFKDSFFLRLCVGLAPGIPKMLVGARVVHKWIEMACPQERGKLGDYYNRDGDLSNPLLETLLSLVPIGSQLSSEEVERVILECWREGNTLWQDLLDLLVDQPLFSVAEKTGNCPTFKKDIISRMSTELKEQLKNICVFRSEEEDAEILSICHGWSEQAKRLMQLCDIAKNVKTNGAIFSTSSLALTGLADVELWEKSITEPSGLSSHHLYFCLMYLLEGIHEPRARLGLLLQSDDSSSSRLLVSILLSFSGRDIAAGLDTAPGSERCAQLLSFFGGREYLPRSTVEPWFQQTVKVVDSQMRSGNFSFACRGVTVLSQLVGLLCGPIREIDLPVEDVQEGEILWYITKDEEEGRKQVRVVKVHNDDFPRLYFTIRLLGKTEGGESAERQTVADRLRRQPSPVSNISSASDGSADEEELRRQDIGTWIVKQLVEPTLSEVSFSRDCLTGEIAGECLNIVISQCGLPEKGGLGTIRYEVFKIVSSLESQIINALHSLELSKELGSMLLTMSSLMGYGRLSPESRRNFETLRFSPENIVAAILDTYTENREHPNGMLDKAVLSWLTVATPSLAGGDLLERTVSLMYRIGVRMLGTHQECVDGQNYLTNSLLVLRATYAIQRSGQHNEEDEEEVLYSNLVKAFTTGWESDAPRDLSHIRLGTDYHQSRPIPRWHYPFSLFLKTTLTKKKKKLLANAARPFANELVEALFVSSKCWCAFRILNAVSTNCVQLKESSICDETQRRLETWQNKLHEEEAEELEDDVATVNHWLPGQLMKELESWAEGDHAAFGQMEDSVKMGQLLSWLCLLSFVDGAAAVDSTSRGSFSSYIFNCGAIDLVLSSALLHANLEKGQNSEVSYSTDALVEDETFVTLSRVSTLVLFRTVEVLPTLFKNWWADDCPKSLSMSVSQFVENKVAPEALKRELVRIRNATNLGEMSVTGSAVSREVAATYVQDECQLSIVIQIPPNFPLRNVEVDGRKTLGIPEKRWKRWALQIRLMLNSQDGTILDALMLWKENVDKEFEGVEPCPVCYSVLSVKTHELPNLECKTCNNRFHSACLHKWFHSSGKSQCVLCQQPWSGSRVQ